MNALPRIFIVLAMFCFAFLPGSAQDRSSDAVESKIDALLQQMTVREKAGQLAQYDAVTPEHMELVKKGEVGSMFNVLGAENTNEVQKVALEHSRLKIPILFAYDVIHGYRTVFPVPIASAGSFDPEMIEQSERVAAKEATAAGIKWAFAPMVDIARDPRWGRMVEGAGEDPYLGSIVAAARVRGFQGKNLADPQSLLACLKHYVGYGAVEGGRDYNTAEISMQTLREVYLPPFHAGVKAGAATIMSAFQDLNGIPASANHFTLTEVLRGEWGFQGPVVSDYSSVNELTVHAIAHDQVEAAELAIMAGVDMDMADGLYGKYLPDLAQSGKVPMSVLDEAVRRVLRAKFEAGIFDNPYTDPKRAASEILSAENRAVARKMAQESITLLKNDGNLLPLDKNTKTIALIGPLVDDKANQLGSWVANGQAKDAVTPLAGIKAKVPQAKILVSRGTDLDTRSSHTGAGTAPAPVSATGAAAVDQPTGPTSIEDAVKTAKMADVVVLFLGEPS
ncbi:MAG TPA: glycoside hydrolase family 3 N-terminal domain-containing protein, partial [Terriglobales bacterium]